MTATEFRVQGSGFRVRSGFGVRGSGFAVLVIVSVVSGFSRTVSAQAVDAAAVYKDNCSSCHDAPTGRTPSRDALKDRTPEAILNAMNSGTMSMQATPLSTAERRAVAEFLSGKSFSAAGASMPNAGLCTTKPAAMANIAAQPQWNGFGVDTSNSRYQPKPGMTARPTP